MHPSGGPRQARCSLLPERVFFATVTVRTSLATISNPAIAWRFRPNDEAGRARLAMRSARRSRPCSPVRSARSTMKHARLHLAAEAAVVLLPDTIRRPYVFFEVECARTLRKQNPSGLPIWVPVICDERQSHDPSACHVHAFDLEYCVQEILESIERSRSHAMTRAFEADRFFHELVTKSPFASRAGAEFAQQIVDDQLPRHGGVYRRLGAIMSVLGGSAARAGRSIDDSPFADDRCRRPTVQHALYMFGVANSGRV